MKNKIHHLIQTNFTVTLSVILGVFIFSADVQAAPIPELDCLIEPYIEVDVSTPEQGVIETIKVDVSDSVEKGQGIIMLDSAVHKATVELNRARASMDDEVQARKASLDFSKRKLARIEQLYDKKALPEHQKEEVETETKLARFNLQQAKNNQRLAQLELVRARVNLKRRTINSPITGVVVKRYKSEGEFVEDDPIVRLAQLDPLRVEVIAPVSLFGKITKGMQAKVMPEISLGNSVFTATVTIVDRVVDVSSGTFGIRLELPNPENQLPSGLKCNIRFDGSEPQLFGFSAESLTPVYTTNLLSTD